MPDPVAVEQMFGRIAGRYDRANRICSLGMDQWWRRRLVASVRQHRPRTVVDLATGSGDVAFALARALSGETKIIGMDFCQPMLDEAERRRLAQPASFPNVSFRQGDALRLPLEDGSVDALTISFGYRNFGNRRDALAEIRRALVPGGLLAILEFSQPHAWFRPFYYLYLKHILPLIAAIITGDRGAYEYLAGSIETFPSREEIIAELKEAGLVEIQAQPIQFGAVALHTAHKPNHPGIS